MHIKLGRTVNLKESVNHDHGFTRLVESMPVTGLGAVIQTTTILTNSDGSKAITTSSAFVPSPTPEKKEGGAAS